MAKQVERLVQDLRCKLVGENGAALRDAELLRLFAVARAEDAFALLVERHGPMILGVCRRILRNDADADDAFQATFLVLARQAGRIRKPDSLAAWLHGIALRLALNMRRDAWKRRQRQQHALLPAPRAATDRAWSELLAGLDEELQRLPAANRQPLVLCYLEGLTQEEAARQLGWPRGTLKRRLERGRELLKTRLTRCGLTLGAGLLATVTTGDALAQVVPASLTGATVASACRWARGGAVGGNAGVLAQGVLKAMFIARLARWTAMFLLSFIACGIAFAAYSAADAPEPPAPMPQAEQAAPPAKPAARSDKQIDGPVARRFEALARQLAIFQTQDFAYGRTPAEDRLVNKLAPKTMLAWGKVSAAISANRDPSADVIALLKHDDPKVRTLALAVLHDRQDPHLLPHLAAMMGDTERTVPTIEIRRAFMVLPAGKAEGLEPGDYQQQTVGQVARAFVGRWLEPAGYRAEEFDAYWAAHKDRTYCTSWLIARLNRAGQGTTGYDKSLARERSRAVRKDVDALPEPDRDWMLLCLAANITSSMELGGYFAEPQELTAAAKRLGPNRLMALLQGKKISDDPDLAPTRKTSWYVHGRGELAQWILKHAGTLLRPTDAPAVLAVSDRYPAPALAAATLQPKQADAWLRAAMDRFPNKDFGVLGGQYRAEIAAGLWRLVGPSEIDYLADWFFGEHVEERSFPAPTVKFLNEIKGVRAPADRKLVARLVTDPRFDKLDYQSLEGLIRIINGWAKQPVVSDEALRVIWEHGSCGPQTPRDFAVLAGWRAKLRGSVKQWAAASK